MIRIRARNQCLTLCIQLTPDVFLATSSRMRAQTAARTLKPCPQSLLFVFDKDRSRILSQRQQLQTLLFLPTPAPVILDLVPRAAGLYLIFEVSASLSCVLATVAHRHGPPASAQSPHIQHAGDCQMSPRLRTTVMWASTRRALRLVRVEEVILCRPPLETKI